MLSYYSFITFIYLYTCKNSSVERFVPARWFRKINEVIESVKQNFSAKIPRIAIIPSNSNATTKGQGIEDTDSGKDENSEETIGQNKDKGKGKGKSSNQEPKSSTEL